jgi:hypothetical protein
MMQLFGTEIDGVRFRLAVYILIAIVVITVASLGITAMGLDLPDFIGTAAVSGLITLEGMVVQSLVKSRDDIQTAKTEVAKIEATKCQE